MGAVSGSDFADRLMRLLDKYDTLSRETMEELKRVIALNRELTAKIADQQTALEGIEFLLRFTRGEDPTKTRLHLMVLKALGKCPET